MTCFFSCSKKETTGNSVSSVPSGTITGRVMAANKTTPVVNAKVFIDDVYNVYVTYSDTSGKFSLAAPEGTYLLNIQSGDGDVFRTSIPDVKVKINEITNLSSTTNIVLHQADSNNLAYIKGIYDDIQTIITSLGYPIKEITVNDLSDLNKIKQFDAIFLNCGKVVMDSMKYVNLQKFVQGGGSLYASDWGIEYLTGFDDVYWKWQPERGGQHEFKMATTCVPRKGGFIEDTTLCSSKTGPLKYTVTGASIMAKDIQTLLGKTTMNIYYNLDEWEVLNKVTSPWEVLVKDKAKYNELAVRTTLSNPDNTSTNPCTGTKGWVTICHIPPGNPNNPITITINCNALNAHLAHGDKIGSCKGNGGNIYYTNFHNHPQGTISDDVKKILQYFVLNL